MNDSAQPLPAGATPTGRVGDPTLVELERRHERLLTEIDGLNERVEAALQAELGEI